jgi:hypothetical protein
MESRPGIHQALDGVAQAQAAHLGDVGHFRRGQAVQVDGVALLDAAEQVFIPLDLEIGMQPALHQHARAAQVERLLDFREDGFLRQNVAFGVAHGPVEGAEAAIFRAEVGVVDVAVDDVGDHVLGMPAAADRVGLHADADEVVGGKQSSAS